ncbi:MAG: hypothetical protein HQL54_03260 [Magnetococcales bacterium]|nr:hypothetical protein [Magnetococcales bacterium]
MAMNNPDIEADGGFYGQFRHKVFRSGIVMIDYMRDQGYDISVRREEDREQLDAVKNTLNIKLYGHFLQAELYLSFTDEYLIDIDNAVRRKWIHHDGKNLKTGSNFGHPAKMPWIATIRQDDQSYEYRITLSFVDTLSIMGYMSLDQVSKTVGVEMPYKDIISSDEKGRMDQVYLEDPDESGLYRFDRYALGDLTMYRILEKYRDLMKEMWGSLSVADYWKDGYIPRLTIGGSIRDLMQALLFKMMEIQPDDKSRQKQLMGILSKCGADHFRSQTDTTIYLAGFSTGGRCRNVRPTDSNAYGALCDVDVQSCYGEGSRAQPYIVGVPVVLFFNRKGAGVIKPTLRQCLDQFGDELVPLHWYATVSMDSLSPLEFPNTFFVSRFDIGKKKKRYWYQDDDHGRGEVKIFTHWIENTVINHDAIQYILHVCSPEQRDELLDRLYVQVLVMYPASERCKTPEEFWALHDNHAGSSGCQLEISKGNTRTVLYEEQCHAWYAETMGELCTNKLLEQRLTFGKEAPEAELRKLIINGIPGVISSQFMEVSNLLVANNITASVRALMWYMESAFQGYQVITDGMVIDLNNVVYPVEDTIQ